MDLIINLGMLIKRDFVNYKNNKIKVLSGMPHELRFNFSQPERSRVN